MYKYFEDYLTSIGIKKEQITFTHPNDAQIFVSVMPNGVDLVNQHIDKYKKWVINTEQATRPHTLGYLGNIKNIIDYSEENIKIFKEKNPTHTFVHIPYAYNPDEIYDFNKTKGIATIGNTSPRRTKIFNKIKNINHIKGWKFRRDEKLFKHKILVNVHFCKEHNITEQLRINRCIYNKMIVISGYPLFCCWRVSIVNRRVNAPSAPRSTATPSFS